MIQTVLLFILGLILICLGGDRLVDAAAVVAESVGAVHAAIGVTVTVAS